MSTTTATTKTTCPYCGVGCGVKATVTQSATSSTISIAGDEQHPANFGKLCSKGSALADTVGLTGRLLTPQVAGQDSDWDTAIGRTAEAFSQAIARHGPNSVAFYVSGQLLTEDYYVANKLMKGYIGAGNIDTNSRLCMSSTVAGHKRAFGADAVPACYDDLAAAKLVLLVGSNTAWCHPIVFQRIQEQREHKKIVVIDPRRTPTAEQADLHLPLKPGSDVALFNGLLHYLHHNGHCDTAYIEQHTEGFAEAIASCADADLANTAARCDLDPALLQQFYEWFAETPQAVSLFSQGVNQSSAGTDKVNAITNVHLATGRIGKEGAGPFSITGQPNAMGGREVGGLANMLAAHMNFGAEECDRVQRFWHSPAIAQQPGLKAVDLFAAIDRGDIKALWIMATNPAVSLPNGNLVQRALERCEFVAVSDCIARTDTTRYADVLFPVTGWAEKDGTVTNSERRISRQRAFLPAAGMAKPDWQVICSVAKAMGYTAGFDYTSPQQIFQEHARLSNFENNGSRAFDISGLSQLDTTEYNHLVPTQWPVSCTASFTAGAVTKPKTTHEQARLFADGKFYTANGKAQFIALTDNLPANPPCAEYPLVLNSGRVRDHWHTMTRTGLSARLASHIVEPQLAMHPTDAQQLQLDNMTLAELTSSWGQLNVRVVHDPSQRVGEVFFPIHWSAQFASSAVIGKVVNPAVDPLSGEPEFKHTPVNVRPRAATEHTRYGFLLSSDPATCNWLEQTAAYWVKAQGAGFSRYEFVLDKAENFALPIANPDDYLEYSDAQLGIHRLAYFAHTQLATVCFLSAQPDLPERHWLGSLFTAADDIVSVRKAILLGESPDPAADVGPIVCSCFGVGKNTLCQGIKQQNLTSVATVGQALQAGSNCGSCRSEIQALLDEAK